MTAPAGWEGILDDDETIVWQGRPDGAITFGPGNAVGMVFGLGFAGFALFWMLLASNAGGSFWMFGLLHFAVGIGVALGAVFWAPYRRRHTWYTLTDKRAFIATALPLRERRLKYYPIHSFSQIDLIQGPLSTVNFAQESRRNAKGRRMTHAVGFERITDGPEVYRLLRDIQIKAETESETS